MNKDTKRYNLVLPDALYDELAQVAEREQGTVVSILRRFIKLGLMVTHMPRGAKLFIRENNVDREIVFTAALARA